MKLKLGQIVNASQPLNGLLSEKLPISAAFKLSSIAKKVEEVLKSYDEIRNKLVEKYGEDNQISPESENWEDFVKEMNELLATDQTLTVDKVKKSDLNGCKISASDLMALEFMIKK